MWVQRLKRLTAAQLPRAGQRAQVTSYFGFTASVMPARPGASDQVGEHVRVVGQAIPRAAVRLIGVMPMPRR